MSGEAIGIGKMDEIDLWGYDAGDDKYHAFTVDNQGTVHDHIGELTDENRVCFKWAGIVEGKPAREEFWMRPLDEDTFMIEDWETVGEDEVMRISATFKRQIKN